MLVAGFEPRCTSSSRTHQDYPFFASRELVVPLPAPTPTPQPPAPQLQLALEGRSIPLQQRAPHGTPPQPLPPHQPLALQQPHGRGTRAEAKTFSPLQLRIDLHAEQGVDEDERPRTAPSDDGPAPVADPPLSRRQRAQLRRRQEQQRPADQVVYQRRAPTRPRTPAPCARTPLAMSTMSMPAAGQKFAADDVAAVFGSAEEASVAVKRLLAKTSSSVVEEQRATSASVDYLQDSFDFLHQRHVKNLSDVIARHQRQSAPSQDRQQVLGQGQPSQPSQHSQQRHKKQVHIHQSAFYDGQQGDTSSNGTFKSTKTINLSNNNSSSSDLDDARTLQQQKRCVRDDSTSSVQSESSAHTAYSNTFDNCNNNFCDAVSVSNNCNTKKMSSKASSVSMSSSSSSTRVEQSFSKKQVIKQSFSSSSQDFEDRIGIDVMLTPTIAAIASSASPSSPVREVAPASPMGLTSSSTRKVKQTTKVVSMTASSDQPEQCKQSVKSFKSKTVKKSVSDGRQEHTDVDKFAETAEEEAEGAPDAPTITFSHVSSEGSHQSSVVHFDLDSSALSSPSRSRSPSPLLETPYSDLSKEIKRPPMEKA